MINKIIFPGHKSVVKLLVENNANVNAKHKTSIIHYHMPIHYAVENGKTLLNQARS